LVYAGAVALWPPLVSAVLATIATVWLTGAFHEDGLADVCDGFGGGWTVEQTLEIMKDSRSGAYGVVGLSLALLLKVSLVAALPVAMAPAILVAAHAASRLMPVYAIAALPYVRADERSKTRPVSRGVSWAGGVAATVFGLAPLALVPTVVWGALLPVGLGSLWLGRLYRRRLGGYTGDALGALQQVSELVFYLGAAALCTYT
jgi:adenosylcobinamide-GDP ribazoletransferase